MPDWEDYYEILQVHPSAEPEVRQAAYRKLAQKYHPDKTKEPDAEERMKKINAAYEVLNNPEKRKQYHKEWLIRNASSFASGPKPKPVVNPEYVLFQDVSPGEIKKDSFVISNTGGAYEKIWFSNPDSWVRVVSWDPVDPNQSDELPLRVEIEAEGQAWTQTYSELIKVKLDEEETQVKIELQTKPEPAEKMRAAARRPFPRWAKYFLTLAGIFVLTMIGLNVYHNVVLKILDKVKSLSTMTDRSVSVVDVYDGVRKKLVSGSLQSEHFFPRTGRSYRFWSPDGGKILFWRAFHQRSRDSSKYYIYMANADGKNVQPIAEKYMSHSFSWSPDGRKIVYIEDRGKRTGTHIVILNANGKKLTEISAPEKAWRGSPSVVNPRWSPDGKNIAFMSCEGLYIMDSYGGNLRKLGRASKFTWAPKGKRIAAQEEQQGFYVVDIYNGRVRLNEKEARGFAWSPDSRKIAFASDSHICLINVDGSNRVKLTEIRPYVDNLVWSPDDKKIAFEEKGYLYLINADSSNRIKLGKSRSFARPPAWSPDGKKIAFSGGGLYVANSDGSNRTRLAGGSSNFEWSPDSKRIAFY